MKIIGHIILMDKINNFKSFAYIALITKISKIKPRKFICHDKINKFPSIVCISSHDFHSVHVSWEVGKFEFKQWMCVISWFKCIKMMLNNWTEKAMFLILFLIFSPRIKEYLRRNFLLPEAFKEPSFLNKFMQLFFNQSDLFNPWNYFRNFFIFFQWNFYSYLMLFGNWAFSLISN